MCGEAAVCGEAAAQAGLETVCPHFVDAATDRGCVRNLSSDSPYSVCRDAGAEQYILPHS